MYSFFPAVQLFRLIKERVMGKGDTPTKKPPVVGSGINGQHCDLASRERESKKAQLVIIAHDIDPIEVGPYLYIMYFLF